MKTIIILLPILMVILIILLCYCPAISKAEEASEPGEGMLAKCPNKPNCVCSEYPESPNHWVAPIIIPETITFDPLPLFKEVINEMGGDVKVDSDNYLAATFTSMFFRFTDDLEARLDSTRKVIHIRSASRVGYSDLGVNRKRTELLKKLFDIKASKINQSQPSP